MTFSAGKSLVSRETDEALRRYQALLHKWQEKINLVSPTTLADSWTRHFEDSLQLLPLLPDQVKTIYDLGCGAGFPGLVLAMARPDVSVTLIESDSKKCAFLKTVSREIPVGVAIENCRIETACASLSPPDLVVARALASLERLFDYALPWCGEDGGNAMRGSCPALLFPKGENWRSEVDSARSAGWTFTLEDYPSRTDPKARLLLFKNLRKNPV